MCPQGDYCHCGREAIVLFLWPEWAMKLCEIHASEYRGYREPTNIYQIVGESDAKTSVN